MRETKQLRSKANSLKACKESNFVCQISLLLRYSTGSIAHLTVAEFLNDL